MKKICFYDTKAYDREYFDKIIKSYDFEIDYYETKLTPRTTILARDHDAVIAFVNDNLSKLTIDRLYDNGIRVVAMRCAGYNNIDLEAAKGKIKVLRVPDYSPYAVAEHAIALILSLNRKIHRAYIRTRDFNFSLNSFVGFDMKGKTVGVIGTGKIGRIFINICKGFGMKICAYDPYPTDDPDIQYMSLEELCEVSDIISLHCPLTKDTRYIINEKTISLMKKSAIIVNTSRGALIDSDALLDALLNEKIRGACLDVYEEETEFFYEDMSNEIPKDDTLARLIYMPNVIVTSHQAFLTHEALANIAETTCNNLRDFFSGKKLKNEVFSNNLANIEK